MAYAAACAERWAHVSAMRLCCSDWCSGSTLAFKTLPAFMTPEKVCKPVGRWTQQAAHIRSISVLVPHELLSPKEVDPNALQAQWEAQMRQCYPQLQQIRWQVDEVQSLVNERMYWLLGQRPEWLWHPDVEHACDWVAVPDMVLSSSICLGHKWTWTVDLDGPLTVRELLEGVNQSVSAPLVGKHRQGYLQGMAEHIWGMDLSVDLNSSEAAELASQEFTRFELFELSGRVYFDVLTSQGSGMYKLHRE